MKNLAYRTVCGGAFGKGSLRIIIAHGLLGNSANWMTVAQRLAEHDLLHSRLDEIMLIDMRNHGNSPHVLPHTNATMASDLEVFVLQHQQQWQRADTQAGGDEGVVLIGHSMGGLALIAALLRRANEKTLLLPSEKELQARFARGDYYGWQDKQEHVKEMRLVNSAMGFHTNELIYDTLFACDHAAPVGLSGRECPKQHYGSRIKASIIVDITPTVGSEKQGDLLNSVASTLDAMTRADLSRMRSFADGSRELERVGLHDKVVRDFVLTNLVLDAKTGVSRWRCNLSALCADYINTRMELREWFLQSATKGTISGEHMVAPVRCVVPTLFVFGEKSPFNIKEDRQLINRFFSNYGEAEVSGAGHFVHYERMREFVEVVAPFIVESCLD